MHQQVAASNGIGILLHRYPALDERLYVVQKTEDEVQILKTMSFGEENK